jgi:hypothetical protein
MTAVASLLSKPASAATVDRSLKAPPMRITDGPSPMRSRAIGVPSPEFTFSRVVFISSLLRSGSGSSGG